MYKYIYISHFLLFIMLHCLLNLLFVFLLHFLLPSFFLFSQLLLCLSCCLFTYLFVRHFCIYLFMLNHLSLYLFIYFTFWSLLYFISFIPFTDQLFWQPSILISFALIHNFHFIKKTPDLKTTDTKLLTHDPKTLHSEPPTPKFESNPLTPGSEPPTPKFDFWPLAQKHTELRTPTLAVLLPDTHRTLAVTGWGCFCSLMEHERILVNSVPYRHAVKYKIVKSETSVGPAFVCLVSLFVPHRITSLSLC